MYKDRKHFVMDKVNKFKLEIIGTQNSFGDLQTLSSHTFENVRTFPVSYVDFVRKYGYGLTADMFHIYIPMGNYGDSLSVRSAEIRSTYYDDVINGELWFDVAPEVTTSILQNLYPFACSDNGEYLFWDLTSGSNESGEMDIYITDFRGLAMQKVADNLYEAIQKLTDDNQYKELLPYATQPLPNTFRYFDTIE
jgi:hypothetical protein